MQRPCASLGAWQEQIAHQRRHQHCAGHQHQAGWQRQQEELEQAQHKRIASIDHTLLQQRAYRDFLDVQRVNQHESGEYRHEEQRGNHQATAEEHQHFPDFVQGSRCLTRLQAGGIELAIFTCGRACPHRTSRQHSTIGHRGLPLQMHPVFEAGIALQNDIRANADFIANGNATQHQFSAFDAGVFQRHGIADACSITNAQQIRRAHRHRAQIGFSSHFGTQCPQPDRMQG